MTYSVPWDPQQPKQRLERADVGVAVAGATKKQMSNHDPVEWQGCALILLGHIMVGRQAHIITHYQASARLSAKYLRASQASAHSQEQPAHGEVTQKQN